MGRRVRAGLVGVGLEHSLKRPVHQVVPQQQLATTVYMN